MEPTYTQRGDYLIPNLVLSDTKEYHIGKYGRMRREGVTEALKADNQMEWVRRRNGIHSRAEEIVLHELVYAE